MRYDQEVRRVPVPSRSKAGQRRRRLARGLARWDHDRQLCAEPTRRIARITLTIPERDPGAAIGRVYRFLAAVRHRWLGTRYFCWLELQQRGAAHYHMIWLNPPSLKRVNLVAWVDRAWGEGRTQVRFSDGRHGLEREIEYAMGYAKKLGKKSYQQRYEEVPSQLRTFMTQRLEVPPAAHDHAIEREVWAYVPADSYRGVYRPAYLEYRGQLVHHVPRGGYCVSLDARRGPPLLRRKVNSGLSTRWPA